LVPAAEKALTQSFAKACGEAVIEATSESEKAETFPMFR
jgi:hypothetical protein